MNNTAVVKFTGLGTTAPFLAMSEFLRTRSRQAADERRKVIERAEKLAKEALTPKSVMHLQNLGGGMFNVRHTVEVWE